MLAVLLGLFSIKALLECVRLSKECDELRETNKRQRNMLVVTKVDIKDILRFDAIRKDNDYITVELNRMYKRLEKSLGE